MALNRERMRHHLPSWTFVVALLAIIVLGTIAFVWFGIYNIAADAPHTRPVYSLVETLRDRSIAAHARGIDAPTDLASAQRIAAGAGLYGEMCASCHLGPGVEPSEISQGLYPRAPDLARHHNLTPAQQFWVIKHGIKMTAMPAWGKTHPDPLIWDMVAFVRKLPGMSPGEYGRLVASAPEEHDEMMEKAGADHHH